MVLLAMKLCQHNTVSGLRCVFAFGLAHHCGGTGESRNDIEITVLDFWPLWLGRLRKIPGQWLYIMFTCGKRKRIWFLATTWSFLLLGGPSFRDIKHIEHKPQEKTERAPFLVHNITVDTAFKSTTMQCCSWINIIVSGTALLTVILVRHIRLHIFLASH